MVRSMISSLRNQGVGVSLDDFGTGYSSLAQLRSLPFDRLKIDRAFISELKDQEHGAKLIDAILTMSDGLKLPVTAEGIEDEVVLEALKRMREAPAAGGAPARPPAHQHASKRYLILTYTSEFDRVHYPVPLGDEAEPDVRSLQRTCMRLRDELRAVRALQGEAGARPAAGALHVRGHSRGREAELAGELRRLREENVSLRVQLKRLDQRGGARADGDDPQAQLERAIRDGRVLDRELTLANKDRESLRGRLERALEELVRTHARTAGGWGGGRRLRGRPASPDRRERPHHTHRNRCDRTRAWRARSASTAARAARPPST